MSSETCVRCHFDSMLAELKAVAKDKCDSSADNSGLILFPWPAPELSAIITAVVQLIVSRTDRITFGVETSLVA